MPVPDVGFSVTQLAVVDAIHVHSPLLDATSRCPFAPSDEYEADDGDTVTEQPPAWSTAIAELPDAIVPVRAAPELAATVYFTVALPVPLGVVT